MSDKLKLPRSSFEELTKIIVAYGRQDKAVSLADIAKTSGLTETRISANVSFLVSMCILEGGQSKKPTAVGFALAKAIEHDIAEELTGRWQEVVKGSDFLSKMVSAVSIRKGMEIQALQSHIAYSAGEPKASFVDVGARAVIEVLKASGLVSQDGDRIVPAGEITSSPVTEGDSGTVTTTSSVTRNHEAPAAHTHSEGAFSTQVIVQVNVQVGAEELDGLAKRLTKFLSDMKKTPTNPE